MNRLSGLGLSSLWRVVIGSGGRCFEHPLGAVPATRPCSVSQAVAGRALPTRAARWRLFIPKRRRHLRSRASSAAPSPGHPTRRVRAADLGSRKGAFCPAEAPAYEGGSCKTDVSCAVLLRARRTPRRGRGIRGLRGPRSWAGLLAVESFIGEHLAEPSAVSLVRWPQPLPSGTAAGNPVEVSCQVLSNPPLPRGSLGRPPQEPKGSYGAGKAAGAASASPSRAVEQLRQAIEELYYFEFVVDDLPIRGFVGYMEESGFLPHTHKIGLWTHLDFHLEFHRDQIIFANVSVRDVKPHSLDGLQPDNFLGLTHTYSVHWSETSVEHRSDRRRGDDGGFFPRTLEIHWLSIINSMVLVFLLVGFVAVILMRVLRNDLARYNLDEETTSGGSGDDFDQGDNGWKIIHTDVFRFPPYRGLLCAVLGVGAQFLALGTGIIVMALLGMFNVHRHGAINSAAILLYALTCCISGYVSSHFYRQIGGERWVWNIILTTSLFSVPFFLTWSVVNSVHWANGSTQALPATTILLLLTVWLLVGFPLTVIGGIFGKNNASPFDAPCRTKNIAREIPPQPWYKSTVIHMTVGGFLPFSAISVELYYIFATVWGREQYTLYGILFFVFAILLSVGACISIALTYFQLSGEDYRWWWRSVLSVGSTGLFIFLYSVFYYARRSNMSGTVQTVEFFGYSLLTGYVFFLMLGTISFFSSLKFIRYIYVNLKMD
ncbi:transmembrane 9 superfamily member 1 isoform X1 [Trichechus manatus latirostris]|uniref:Transmembrane 9 superfamily member n=1 Tax=Trichechus manatus latirostris TaxID=127582 RepID=A0A2Y9QP63_TRIMA|nr:transmembrane 9 superfamily member 1 isoform X1 [Trichechus manatus latirostris]